MSRGDHKIYSETGDISASEKGYYSQLFWNRKNRNPARCLLGVSTCLQEQRRLHMLRCESFTPREEKKSEFLYNCGYDFYKYYFMIFIHVGSLFLRIYKYLCICMYVYIHIYLYAIYIYKYIYLYIYTYFGIYLYTYIYFYVYIHTHIYFYISTFKYPGIGLIV